jgi:SRSO17 transposase
MYGDEDVIGALNQLKLDFIVAIRSNHPVWLLPEQRVQYSRWFVYEQTLPYRQSDLRFIREIIFSQRCPLRYYQISKNIDPDPKSENMWLITTNLPGTSS